MGLIILYILWCLIPLFFFVMALWAKLEQVSNRSQAQNPGDFFRNGVFVAIAVAVAILIDQFLLQSLVNFISPSWLPIGLCRVALLPIILYAMALISGPTADIQIRKAPRPSAKKGPKRH